jgi:hypothetical protein
MTITALATQTLMEVEIKTMTTRYLSLLGLNCKMGNRYGQTRIGFGWDGTGRGGIAFIAQMML